MRVRDYFITPATESHVADSAVSEVDAAAPRIDPAAGADRAASGARAVSLGLLATAHDLRAVAAAVGVVLARRAPAALVCLHGPGAELPAAGLWLPPRTAAARLATSLAARGVEAQARGRLVFTCASDGTRAEAAARALAAAGSLPTLLATGARSAEVDELLATRDALLVALPASVDPDLAALALTGARELACSAAAVTVALDPLSRRLALAGLRAPSAVADAIAGVVG